MTIFSRHPYSFLFAGAGIVLIAIILSTRHASTAPPALAPSTSYVGDGALINPGMGPIVGSTQPTIVNAPPPVQTLIPATPAPAVTGVAKVPSGSTNQPSAPAFAANPTPSPQTGTSESDSLLQYAYSFFQISGGVQVATQAATPEQQAMRAYGNEAGLAVLSFENAHADMADVLQRWLASRANSANIAQVKQIATDMIAAGEALSQLPHVPEAATGINAALADNFLTAGKQLILVSQAGGSDDNLLPAIKAYDAAADAFTQSYLAVSNAFSLRNITFGASEPGSAFQFSGSGGL